MSSLTTPSSSCLPTPSETLELFFTSNDKKCILVPESLKIVEAMPSRLPKMKCLAISKMVGELTEANIHSSTFVGEIGGMSSFEHLELVSKNVLLPVLYNQTNQTSWGDLTSREITDCFHSFLSSSAILCGQVKAETRLPTPPLYGKTAVPIRIHQPHIVAGEHHHHLDEADQAGSGGGAQLKLGFRPTHDVEISF